RPESTARPDPDFDLNIFGGMFTMKLIPRLLLVICFLITMSIAPMAQEPVVVQQELPSPGVRPGLTPPSQDPQPYEKVITKDAKSKKGVFTVHQVKDKYYYEIPKKELDKDFLWVTQIARTTLGVGYGGQALGNRVVRWERNGNKINLRNIDYSVVAN